MKKCDLNAEKQCDLSAKNCDLYAKKKTLMQKTM